MSESISMKQLEDKTMKELYELARKYDIPRYTSMRKQDLIFEILEAKAKSEGFFFGEGVLEIAPDGYGFLRSLETMLSGPKDIYISQSQIRKFNLNTGDIVSGVIRPPKEGERFNAMIKIEAINYKPPEFADERVNFENLTPDYPRERYLLEAERNIYSTRLMDLFAPIGKGQRGMIVAPPKAGKTTVLKEIANGIAQNHPDTIRIVLLIDERPEEVTDIKESVNAKVIAAPFDMPSDKQIKIAELTLEMCKRLVEYGNHVIVLLDSLTRLARVYNITVPPSGKLLTGGVDPAALYKPKQFFGAARNTREGGSFTIIATALVETGSKMDEVIFEEFKGTGNMELVLSRQLANKRIFPAINLSLSGTRKEELLIEQNVLKKVWILRRMLTSMNEEEGLKLIISKLKDTKSNDDFIALVDAQKNV